MNKTQKTPYGIKPSGKLKYLKSLLAISLVFGAANLLPAENGQTIDVKLGKNIQRSLDDVIKANYAYGPKQEFDSKTRETHIWLPYGSKGVYYETMGVNLTDSPGTPLVVTVDGNTCGRLVYKLHFDKPIASFRLGIGFSEWGVNGETVGGIEFSTDGKKWTNIREVTKAGIVEPFLDADKTKVAGLKTQELYIRFYSRVKKDPEAASGPACWMKFRLAGDPSWGDASTTFFGTQPQLWVTPAE